MATKVDKKSMVLVVLMLVLLVVLCVATVTRMIRKSSEAEAARSTKPAPMAVEDLADVDKVVKRGKITAASGRTGDEDETAAPDKAEQADGKDDRWDLFGKESRRKKEAEASLREAVDQVQGLGVYVASDDEGNEDE